jgi:micrococcal nuclease
MIRKKTKLRNINLISVVLFLFAAAFYLVLEQPLLSEKQVGHGFVPVVEVYDGDTLGVIINNKREKVRLTGIDAPETGQVPWGARAKHYLQTLVSEAGRQVKLEFDVEQRDRYGRILANLITPDGKHINLLMVKNGYAVLYTVPPNVRYASELAAAQTEAREKKIGIWSDQGLKERPYDYRRTHPRK